MGLIDGKAAKRSILRKLLRPSGLAELRRRSRQKGQHRRVDEDPELKLYGRMLDKDFLHFGWFEDPDLTGEDISFAMLMAAQVRYGEKIVERVRSADGRVLDGGCGMGGLIDPLRAAGHVPVALTPDRNQIAHITGKYPDLAVEHCRFEDIDADRYAGAFDTVINSESLQYIDLDAAIGVVGKVAAPGGRWVVCDFFREAGQSDAAGHRLEEFRTRTAAAGWQVIEETDITPNILPTLAFAHMLGHRLVLPMAEYFGDKMRQKSPGLHYLLEDVFAQLIPGLEAQLQVVEPAEFAANKSYRLFVLERG